MKNLCIDCQKCEGVVFWGGGPRCQICSDAFNEIVIAKRRAQYAAEMARKAAHVCGSDDDDLCEECCEHGDICMDERGCLDCGKDMSENLMSAAYDRAKDLRKYGA